MVEIDAGELAEAEEHFLFVSLVDCYGFELLDRKFSGLDRGYILSGVVRVRPARRTVERVGACSEAEVRFAAPVFQIVA